jgi:hypothetical protein
VVVTAWVTGTATPVPSTGACFRDHRR